MKDFPGVVVKQNNFMNLALDIDLLEEEQLLSTPRVTDHKSIGK
jgi:hypothetical protein